MAHNSIAQCANPWFTINFEAGLVAITTNLFITHALNQLNSLYCIIFLYKGEMVTTNISLQVIDLQDRSKNWHHPSNNDMVFLNEDL